MHPVLIAARLTVRDLGGAEQAGRHIDKAGSTLAHELDPNCRHAKLGLLDAVTLSAAAGDVRIAQAYAAELNGMFVPLAAGEAAGGDTMRHVTALAAEFADVMREVSGALADGDVSDNELVRVQQQGHELMGALQALMVHLAQRNQAGKPPAPALKAVR